MKKIAQFCVLVIVVGLISTTLFAQTKPTSEDALAFINFYFSGQGQGVVLADMKVCTTIEENECTDNVPLTSLKMDEQYMLWMMYVVPKDDKVDNILVQFNQGGITRITKEVSVVGSIRYRTWKSFSLNRTGEWEIKVLHDKPEGVEVLKSITVTVTE